MPSSEGIIVCVLSRPRHLLKMVKVKMVIFIYPLILFINDKLYGQLMTIICYTIFKESDS